MLNNVRYWIDAVLEIFRRYPKKLDVLANANSGTTKDVVLKPKTGPDIESLHKLVIEPTLTYMASKTDRPWLASKNAQALMLGIATQESALRYTRQLGNGPARSYFQCEPATAKDVLHRYTRVGSPYRDMVNSFVHDGIMENAGNFNFALQFDQSFACMIARLKLADADPALPPWHQVAELARYWKLYFNTIKGKGQPHEFQEAFARHDIITYLEGEFGAVDV